MNATQAEASVFLALSLIILLLCVLFSGLYVYEYCLRGTRQSDLQPLQNWFKYNTMLSVVLNVLCASFVFAYFTWIVVDPLPADMLYFFHESHQLRIVITVLHYVSTIFPFLIFNGRLKYTFKQGKYAASQNLFVALNVAAIVLAPLSVTLGYLGVFVYHSPSMEWVGFNLYRILYIILLLLLCTLFNKRILLITIQQAKFAHASLAKIGRKKKPRRRGSVGDATEATSSRKINNNHSTTTYALTETSSEKTPDAADSVGDQPATSADEEKEIIAYLNVVVTSSLLLTFMVVSKIMVMTAWFLHNYTYGQGHYSLCVGFLFMALDSLVDQIGVILLFKQTRKYYNLLCGCSRLSADMHSLRGVHGCFFRCCTALTVCYQKRQGESDNAN